VSGPWLAAHVVHGDNLTDRLWAAALDALP
jgi:hypothetical protein